MKPNRKHTILLIIFLGLILTAGSFGQEGVGLPFLKIGIGARQAGMGGVFTGVADDIYSIYWNPGGLGHIRRWAWSASYNRWFTDVYQASFGFVQQFRVLGSKKTTIGFHATYFGMPSWDSTGGDKPAVSAGHFTAGVSFGSRVDWITRALSVGATVRALSCRYESYSAEGLTTDFGILIKPDRFRLGNAGMGIFDYGVISLGAAILHLGENITFDTQPTSLPRTIRAGISFRVGRYNGLSVMLASDAVLVQGRDWEMAAAAEIWYRDIIGVRAGFQKNGRDLGELSFGMSLRWDDVINSILGRPTRFGDAIEIDFAGADYGNALQETYRGAFSHYPVAPEPFRFEESGILMSQVMGQTSVVTLRWEKAADPDPFDEVAYLLLVDKDKSRVNEAVRWVERDMAGFLASNLKDSLLACESLPGTEFSLPVNEGGVYHWAVAAYDLRQHARLAKRGRELVKQFVVETADLIVQDIEFLPTQWITTTTEQGTLTVTAANQSIAVRDSFRLVVTDEYLFADADERTQETVLLDVVIPGMRVQQDTTFTIEWSTEFQGPHRIRAMMDPDSSIFELKKENNSYHEVIVSVPKGVLAASDTVEVVSTEYDYIEIPLVPEIYFDPHTSAIKPEYHTDGDALPPVLLTLAQRLQDHPNVTLSVMGAIDRLSGETDPSLADRRAENVKGQLVSLGVPESRVVVQIDHPGKVLGQRRAPVDAQDAMWVMEQNRMVTFAVPLEYEEAIFGPHKLDVETTLRDSVSFDVRVVSPGEIAAWGVYGTAEEIEINREGLTHEQHLDGVFVWNGMDRSDVLVPRNRWYGYALVLTDTLNRTFRTPPDSVYMLERRTIRRHEVFGAAKFAQTQPVYQFYWDRLMNLAQEFIQNKNMRIRFEGHACAVGPDRVNERLSFRRAEQFTQAFRERLQQAYPDSYREAMLRIEAPVGFGEKEPMRVMLRATGEEVLLGDNQSPVGRYLNRRIMVALYREY